MLNDLFEFNNELSEYEKTILYLASVYSISPIYQLDDVTLSSLSAFLKIDYTLLKKALTSDFNLFYKKYAETNCTFEYNLNDNCLFHMLIQLCFAYENIKKISDITDFENMRDNLNVFQSISHFFNMLNVETATYECMYNNKFSFDYTPYDLPYTSPSNYIDTLLLLLSSGNSLKFDKDFYNILSDMLQYEFLTRLNAISLLISCQIIKHSCHFDDCIKEIAEEMYSNLLFILKNGKVISISINTLYFESDTPVEVRTRNDNTTRLQMLYGYANFDDYELRLDFSHGSQTFTHFNNQSPGGVKSFLFNEIEYKNIIKVYPELENCFICYGNQWALKEKQNCSLTTEQTEIYDAVSASQEHYKVFEKSYSENAIDDFLRILSYFLPEYFKRAIDTDRTYVTCCLNYDRIIKEILKLYLSYLGSWLPNCGDFTEDLIKSIAQKAFESNIITITERDAINSFEDIHYIILDMRNKIL